GSAVSFTVTTLAGYPTATTMTKTGRLPAGVSFTDNGNGTATIAGTATASGAFTITITASNGASTDATQSFTLTVTKKPAITSGNSATFVIGSAGTFSVTTTAGYPTATTLTETGALPSGVSFTDNGNGTATIAGTPAAGTAGSYPLTITASNSAGSTQQSFTLTVNPANASPVITSADHTTFTVGSAGSFTVTTVAGYPTATTLTKTGTLPVGVSFTDNGDGTATIAGTPAAGSAGSYPLTISATNATGTRQQSFTLTVVPANASPVITSADHATFALGTADSFTVTTTAGYPTATTITKTGSLPAGVSFTDNHNGTATIAGTPSVAGAFTITITASTGASTDATQTFTLTVNAPPVITSANTATFTSDLAGQSFTVTTTAGYPTATTLTETGALPAGVTFTDNHNGTATIAGTPSVTTSTDYPIVIKASNGIAPDASQSFTLKVTKVAAVALPSSKPKADGTLGGVPSKVYVNQVLTVTGTGYKPGAPIEIGWYYSSSGKVTKLTVLAHGFADAAGKFRIPVTVANNTGSKTVMSAGIGSNGKARYLGADTVVNPPLTSSLLMGVPLTTTVGNSLTVSGSGYQPGTSIEIGWYLPQTVLGHTLADAAGKFRATVALPADQTGLKALYAAGLGSNGKARYMVAPTLVKGRSSTSTGHTTQPIGGTGTGGTGTSTGGGGLANTGLTDQRISAASAGALALTGFALMMIGRRRREEDK
ncbi:MAG: hypothetical protein QOE23_2595, partial [Pseudonocardiales bacterium]|nr:hypothetical protein [Pseudonocardiales bacterium]